MGLYDQIKDIAKIVQKADNIELYRQILDVQKDALDLLEENSKLKERIKDLEKEKNLEKSIKYINDVYYKTENGVKDGPYCRVCWEKDRKLIRMSTGNYTGGIKAYCDVCHYSAYDSK